MTPYYDSGLYYLKVIDTENQTNIGKEEAKSELSVLPPNRI